MCDPSSSNTHTVLCASTPQVLIWIEAVAPKKAAAKFSDTIAQVPWHHSFRALQHPLSFAHQASQISLGFSGTTLILPPKSFLVQTITPGLLPWPLPCTLVQLSLWDSILGMPWLWHPWRSPVCVQILARVRPWAAQAWPEADIATKTFQLKGNRGSQHLHTQ